MTIFPHTHIQAGAHIQIKETINWVKQIKKKSNHDTTVDSCFALQSCCATACLCLPWPLIIYYLGHADTSHLRWSASGLAPLLSSIPAIVTPNTPLQGSVPIYNGGVSSCCIVAVCQHFLLSFSDLFSTSCLCGGLLVIPRVLW